MKPIFIWVESRSDPYGVEPYPAGRAIYLPKGRVWLIKFFANQRQLYYLTEDPNQRGHYVVFRGAKKKGGGVKFKKAVATGQIRVLDRAYLAINFPLVRRSYLMDLGDGFTGGEKCIS